MTAFIIKPRACGKTFAAQPPCITADDLATARIAIRAARLLRDVDRVGLAALRDAIDAEARRGACPPLHDNSHLVRVMQRLGWRKHGYTDAGRRRSPLYVRVATSEPRP